MEQRSIGGFKVSVLGLGTGRLASLGAGGTLREAARLLDAAADLGVSFIDTADTYGSTQAERWLGELMQKSGKQFVVATKCGLPTVDLPRPLRALNQPAKKVIQRISPKQHYLDPAYVRRSIDCSLKRLRRERVELYFIHEPPTGVERMDQLFSILDDARTAGKIGAYGVCTPDPQIIRATIGANRCEIVQTAVDPLGTDRLRWALESAGEPRRIEVVANHVLGRVRPPAAVPGDAAEGAVLFDRRLTALSAERGVSRAHLLIRHAAALGNVRVVLTGTGNPAHLAANAAALALPATQEDLLA